MSGAVQAARGRVEGGVSERDRERERGERVRCLWSDKPSFSRHQAEALMNTDQDNEFIICFLLSLFRSLCRSID